MKTRYVRMKGTSLVARAVGRAKDGLLDVRYPEAECGDVHVWKASKAETISRYRYASLISAFKCKLQKTVARIARDFRKKT